MSFVFQVLLVAVGLFVGMVGLLELGRRLGLRRRRQQGDAATGALDGVVFALLGLLLAFSFSGAASRFQERRDLIVQEANDIGTAWLRLDLLPPPAQPALRELFRRYLDSRLAMHQSRSDRAAEAREIRLSTDLQGQIWNQSVAGVREAHDTAITSLVLSAQNTMFDIMQTRVAGLEHHPPNIVFAMLFLLALGCAFVAGDGLAASPERRPLHMIAFAAAIAFSVYVILDLEYPRLGLIRVDDADRVLVDLRASMR
jgi:hypothetical protein